MIEVIRTPSSPHGTIHPNGCRSFWTLTANPCVVTPRERCTPIEAILRSSTHTPVYAGPSSERARATTPSSANAATTASSSDRTYATTSSVRTIG
jgi:hypothetical protein